jgi:isopenicillin N synthase-like dioxygenase
MYSTLPEIDFSRFLTGSDKDREAISSQLDDALKNPGSFLLRNHGIPLKTIDDCFDWVSRLYFSTGLCTYRN